MPKAVLALTPSASKAHRRPRHLELNSGGRNIKYEKMQGISPNLRNRQLFPAGKNREGFLSPPRARFDRNL